MMKVIGFFMSDEICYSEQHTLMSMLLINLQNTYLSLTLIPSFFLWP